MKIYWTCSHLHSLKERGKRQIMLVRLPVLSQSTFSSSDGMQDVHPHHYQQPWAVTAVAAGQKLYSSFSEAPQEKKTYEYHPLNACSAVKSTVWQAGSQERLYWRWIAQATICPLISSQTLKDPFVASAYDRRRILWETIASQPATHLLSKTHKEHPLNSATNHNWLPAITAAACVFSTVQQPPLEVPCSLHTSQISLFRLSTLAQ